MLSVENIFLGKLKAGESHVLTNVCIILNLCKTTIYHTFLGINVLDFFMTFPESKMKFHDLPPDVLPVNIRTTAHKSKTKHIIMWRE